MLVICRPPTLPESGSGIGRDANPVERLSVRCSCPRKARLLAWPGWYISLGHWLHPVLSPFAGFVSRRSPWCPFVPFFPTLSPEHSLKWPLFSTGLCESVILKWAHVTLLSESPFGPSALGIWPTGHANQTWLPCWFLITPFLRGCASAHVFILLSFGSW